MYITRKIDSDLLSWKDSEYRKPLIIRGVRQCGKTSSIRMMGRNFRYFIEINFEKMPEAKKIFRGNLDIKRISAELEEFAGIPLIEGESLLFLDELQECTEAIQALRYFYEERPDLHVIGAGSFLEFALNRIPSFGVGRITSLFMKPLSFAEFLNALDEKILLASIEKADVDNPLSDVAHQKLLELMKIFIVVGGMPEAVTRYMETKSILQARFVHNDILTSLYDDFYKYDKEIPAEILTMIFRFAISRVGAQISYNKNTIPNLDSSTISKGLKILSDAGLLGIVYASACSSLPIAALVNHNRKKVLFSDTGLYLSAVGLDVSQFTLETDFNSLNIGNVCELFAGLELMKALPSYIKPELYFWTRDADKTNRGIAEIDYVIQRGAAIVPVEVKARVQGGMKSLWAFLEKHPDSYGIRTSLENFGTMDRLLIYPLYAISRIIAD